MYVVRYLFFRPFAMSLFPSLFISRCRSFFSSFFLYLVRPVFLSVYVCGSFLSFDIVVISLVI